MDQREYQDLPDYRGHRDFLDLLVALRDHPVCIVRIVLIKGREKKNKEKKIENNKKSFV